MALVSVEVVGRPLTIGRGPMFGVGERMALDDSKPQHAEIIRRGWVTVLLPSTAVTSSPSIASLDVAPKDKMVQRRSSKRKSRTK
jgi:hypothetical protein